MATIPVRLDENCDYGKINHLFKDIETKGKKHLKNDGFNEEEVDIYRSLEMRYLGQIHECTVNYQQQLKKLKKHSTNDMKNFILILSYKALSS